MRNNIKQARRAYYAIHEDGEPVRYTACHTIVTYDTEQEAQEDNPNNEIRCAMSTLTECGSWVLDL